MKTVKKIMLSLSLLGGVLSVNAQAELSMDNFYLMPGETKTVTINMNNTVDIRALQVLVDLPKHVKMVARPIVVADRQGEAKDEFGQSVDVKKTLSYKIREDGSCMIVVNANDAVPFSGSVGAVISLTLKADEDASDCSEKIELQDIELVYADGYTYVRPSDYSCNVDIYKNILSIKELQKRELGDVDVYNLGGQKIKENVPVAELQHEIPSGVYVIEGMKVLIKNH